MLVALAVAAGGRVPPGRSTVKDVWRNLDRTRNTCREEFDYHPDGGMRIFACHLRSLITYKRLQKLAGTRIFLDGPHTRGHLDLEARRSFGRYNPAFVRWAVDNLIPAADNVAFRQRTQPLYDRYVRPLAAIFLVTYQKTRAEPGCFEREVERYTDFLRGAKGPRVSDMPYERYFYFMNKRFCEKPDGGFDYFVDRGFDGRVSGNVVKTCVAWWIRRTIDGTAFEWFRGLQKLIRTYDPELLDPPSPKDPGPPNRLD